MTWILVLIFCACLIWHTYTDLKEMLLYDSVNLILCIAGMFYSFIIGNLVEAICGLAIGFTVMLGIYMISQGGLGEGDVKLMPSLGIWLGVEKTLLTLLVAFVLGAIIGICIIFVKHKKSDEAIPFGPFLCLGAFLSFFLGDKIINLYYCFFF